LDSGVAVVAVRTEEEEGGEEEMVGVQGGGCSSSLAVAVAKNWPGRGLVSDTAVVDAKREEKEKVTLGVKGDWVAVW